LAQVSQSHRAGRQCGSSSHIKVARSTEIESKRYTEEKPKGQYNKNQIKGQKVNVKAYIVIPYSLFLVRKFPTSKECLLPS
jgi:hypothetical protein